MHRFFTTDIAGNAAAITGDDVRHIGRVLRLHAGDALRLCDGCGTEYDARIEQITEQAVRCQLGAPMPSESEPPCRITLFQCLPKTGKMETILQKCTELGANAFVPVLSARCVALPVRDVSNKLTRWQRVALEAAKQSRRGVIPTVERILPIDQIDPGAFDLFLFANEEERAQSAKRVLRALKGMPRTAAILIGPEGGFSAEEADALVRRGATSVTLGKRILRTETAGMALMAQLVYELEDA